MAKVHLRNGTDELLRFVTMKGRGYLIRSDGMVLIRSGDGWKQKGKLKAEHLADLSTYIESVRRGESGWGKVLVGVTPPSWDTIAKWEREKGQCKALDGCKVEPDGSCPHGYPSWLAWRGPL